jgi:hypothetical protein
MATVCGVQIPLSAPAKAVKKKRRKPRVHYLEA